jgi:hypothetical protein
MKLELVSKEEKEDALSAIQRVIEDSILLRIPLLVEIAELVLPKDQVQDPQTRLPFVPAEAACEVGRFDE